MQIPLEMPRQAQEDLYNALYQIFIEAKQDALKLVLLEKDYLTPREVFRYLDIKQSTLDKWVVEGLPQHKIGGKVFYKKLDLGKFIEKH